MILHQCRNSLVIRAVRKLHSEKVGNYVTRLSVTRGQSLRGQGLWGTYNNGPHNFCFINNADSHARLLFSSSPVLSNIKKTSFDSDNQLKKSLSQTLVDRSPKKLQPYLRLSRVHQPIGTWLLFWPCTWGLALSSGGIPSLELVALFGTGAFIMRGAGCTVNDMWDKHIDRQVKRTSGRPLAAGELRMRHAAAWLAFQLSLALSILVQLNPSCFIIGVGSLGFVTAYPLMKRVTNWPQAVLGSTFNIGVLMGFTAASKYSQLGYLTFPWLDPSCISLYLAGISWTLIYDTIYAHQDREDDQTLGLGSTARRFGNDTKMWLSGFSCTTIASLLACGVLENLQWPYYLGVAAVGSHLAWQIKTLDINNSQNCSDRFKSNRHIGWLIFLGIVGSSLYSKQGDNTKISSVLINGENYLKIPSNSATYTSQIKMENS